MKYGILHSNQIRPLFEEINKCNFCADCHQARHEFKERDFKTYKRYSNLLPGFSSEIVQIPIDILIIAEAHGGGRASDFRDQKSLDEEVNNIGNYYLVNQLEKFHQQQMRHFFNSLNKYSKSWIFTDLIKCFVWQNKDGNLNGSRNRDIAVEYCKGYLTKQIAVLQPKNILILGNNVATKYFSLKKAYHGEIYPPAKERTAKLIFSRFPSRNTADLWVKDGGWDKIIPILIG